MAVLVNPRYLNYCRVHGLTPEQMAMADDETWPGGCMTGFFLWLGRQRVAFQRAHPEAFLDGHVADHEAWDRWLDAEPVQSDGGVPA